MNFNKDEWQFLEFLYGDNKFGLDSLVYNNALPKMVFYRIVDHIIDFTKFNSHINRANIKGKWIYFHYKNLDFYKICGNM